MPRPKGVKDEFFAMTCMEIGREIGVSHSRVQQILTGALEKLRVEFSQRGITGIPPAPENHWQELMKRAEEGEGDEC
jgi:hypothetical protein